MLPILFCQLKNSTQVEHFGIDLPVHLSSPCGQRLIAAQQFLNVSTHQVLPACFLIHPNTSQLFSLPNNGHGNSFLHRRARCATNCSSSTHITTTIDSLISCTALLMGLAFLLPVKQYDANNMKLFWILQYNCNVEHF